MNRTEYLKIRDRLAAEPHKILAMEQYYSESLVQIVLNSADLIYRDFHAANQTIPFWKAYAPKQRGRRPTGMASPWSEVGEKSISSNLLNQTTAEWYTQRSLQVGTHAPSRAFGGE
ncbi:MAG: BglI family type II restriction endonuclease [Acidobacteria bacterium]|nr:BglI family type II restriction endonuclease [Acidobacteriota bacterium]